MGLGTGLLRIILFICNVVFFIAGGLMLAIGIVLLVTDFGEYIDDFLSTINETIFVAATWTLISLGALIFIMGFLGCCGTCKDSSCMLRSFTIFMCVVMVIEVIAVFYGGKLLTRIGSDLEGNMQDQIMFDYVNDTSEDKYSKSWNHIQEEMECCGAESFLDYGGSAYYNTTGQLVPYTCCKDVTNVTECRAEAEIRTDPMCNEMTPTAGNWDQLNPCGCVGPVGDKLELLGTSFVAVIAIAIGCEVLLVIFACCLVSSLAKVHPV